MIDEQIQLLKELKEIGYINIYGKNPLIMEIDELKSFIKFIKKRFNK